MVRTTSEVRAEMTDTMVYRMTFRPSGVWAVLPEPDHGAASSAGQVTPSVPIVELGGQIRPAR